MTILHMKMLEENRYYDGRFQSVTTAFNSPHKNLKDNGESDNEFENEEKC